MVVQWPPDINIKVYLNVCLNSKVSLLWSVDKKKNFKFNKLVFNTQTRFAL